MERLEERALLATLTAVEVADGIDFEVSGSLVSNIPDVYLRTSDVGQLQYSEDNVNFTDTSFNLADGSVDSLNLDVVYTNPTNEEWTRYLQNIWNDDTDRQGLTSIYLGNIDAPGVDLSFSSLDIIVEAGSTISTRDIGSASDPLTAESVGDSGDISFYSPVVNIDGDILANVGADDTTNTAGDITIDAIGSLDDIASGFTVAIPFADVTETNARVRLDSATLRGRDITINAEADASDLFDDGDPAGGWGEALAEWVGSLSVLAGVALSEAEAEIDINNSEIVGRNVSLSSAADADAEATVLSFYLAVAYGHSIPHATVDIRGGSSIVATDDLSIATDANSDLNIIATQNLVGTSTVVEKRNITLAGSYSDVVSKAELSGDSTLAVGDDFVVDVFATREHNTQSNAAAYGDGTLGVALNVAVHESQVEALIDGDVTTGGDMTVEAELETLKNDFNATSTVGTGAIGGRFQRAIRADRVGDAFGSAFGGLGISGTVSGAVKFGVA